MKKLQALFVVLAVIVSMTTPAIVTAKTWHVAGKNCAHDFIIEIGPLLARGSVIVELGWRGINTRKFELRKGQNPIETQFVYDIYKVNQGELVWNENNEVVWVGGSAQLTGCAQHYFDANEVIGTVSE